MNTMLPWNALYTKPGCEEKACRLLKKRNVVFYYPVNKILSNKANKAAFLLKPLFPSIIFVQVIDDWQLERLVKLSAIRSLAYWQNKPATFSGLEIELLKDFVSTYLTVKATKLNLNTNNNIRLQGAEIQRIAATDSIHCINLPSVGYSLSAEPEVITTVRLQKRITDWQKIAESFAFTLGYRNSDQQ